VSFAHSENRIGIELQGLDITVAQMDAALRHALQGTGQDIPPNWQSRAGVGNRGFLRAGVVHRLLRDRASREYYHDHGRYAIMYAPDHGDNDGLQTQYDILNDAVSLHDFDLLTPSISSHALDSATYELRRGSAGDEVHASLPWSKLLLAETRLMERGGGDADVDASEVAGAGGAPLPQTIDVLVSFHDERPTHLVRVSSETTVGWLEYSLRAEHFMHIDFPLFWKARSAVGDKLFLREGNLRELLSAMPEQVQLHAQKAYFAVEYVPDAKDMLGKQTLFDLTNEHVPAPAFRALANNASTEALRFAITHVRDSDRGRVEPKLRIATEILETRDSGGCVPVSALLCPVCTSQYTWAKTTCNNPVALGCPAAHVVCAECAEALSKCPICRGTKAPVTPLSDLMTAEEFVAIHDDGMHTTTGGKRFVLGGRKRAEARRTSFRSDQHRRRTSLYP
jgi:hypothetical protein